MISPATFNYILEILDLCRGCDDGREVSKLMEEIPFGMLVIDDVPV